MWAVWKMWLVRIKWERTTALRTQSRASWRSAVSSLWSKGQRGMDSWWNTLIQKGLGSLTSVAPIGKPTNSVGLKENQWETPWSPDTSRQPSVTKKIKKKILRLGLMWKPTLRCTCLFSLISSYKTGKTQREQIGHLPLLLLGSFASRCLGTNNNSWARKGYVSW